MRSIAIINQKGGVGKTTTAVNVSAALARAGLRTLLVDLDPQAHATIHLGLEVRPENGSVYDVLVNGAAARDVTQIVTDNLTAIPAHLDLVAAELELGSRRERELILAQALEPLRERFDILLIDCPPSLGLLTINALAAVDEVVIPLQPHFLALQGLGRLLETASLVRGVLKPGLCVSGIVLCLYDSVTRLAQEVRTDVSQFVRDAEFQDAWYGARVFDTCIRRNIKLAECPSFGQTIFDYAPRSNGAEDYAALAREIMAMSPATAATSAAVTNGTTGPAAPEPSAGPIVTVDADAIPLLSTELLPGSPVQPGHGHSGEAASPAQDPQDAPLP
ncbi:MAG: AAA family ATPase [Planctomycetes bacterium]|nr:AAA family ATPase [Planctomycetota bacterium]